MDKTEKKLLFPYYRIVCLLCWWYGRYLLSNTSKKRGKKFNFQLWKYNGQCPMLVQKNSSNEILIDFYQNFKLDQWSYSVCHQDDNEICSDNLMRQQLW